MNGVRRVIDELGRVTLPKSMRNALGINDGLSELEIQIHEDVIMITNPKASDKKLTCAIDIVNREIRKSKNLDPKVLSGMQQIKKAISKEVERG